MILIHPFAQKLRNGSENPKNFPHWEELIDMIDEPIVQIGVEGERQLVPDFRKNMKMGEITNLLRECTTFISVDSFLHHLAWKQCVSGIVLWGKGDPDIFGHKIHRNLLKNRENLRKNQFATWEEEAYDPAVFVSAEEVRNSIYGK